MADARGLLAIGDVGVATGPHGDWNTNRAGCEARFVPASRAQCFTGKRGRGRLGTSGAPLKAEAGLSGMRERDEAEKRATPAEQAPGGATGIFGAPASGPSSPQEEAVQVPPGSKAGEFTQLFGAPSAPNPADVNRGVPPPRPDAYPPERPPGEFTQIFTQLRTPASANPPFGPPPPKPHVSSSPPPAAHRSAQEGEFTEFFERLNPPPPPPAPPQVAKPQFAQPEERRSPAADKAPGAFTQLFQSIQAEANPRGAPSPPTQPLPRPREERTAPPVPPEPGSSTRPTASPASGGFTQMFGSLAAADAARSTPLAPPAARAPLPPEREPEPFFARESQPTPRPGAVDGSPLHAGPGEFTRLMQTLSAAPEQTATPPAPPEPAAPPPSGPGEFTRVISQSTLRDTGSASASPSQPAAAPPVAPPSSFPPMPHPPSLGAMPHFPLAPPPQPPPPAAAAPPPGKLHKYLPLLLVSNAFLLLLLILAVFFLLTRK